MWCSGWRAPHSTGADRHSAIPISYLLQLRSHWDHQHQPPIARGTQLQQMDWVFLGVHTDPPQFPENGR